MGLKLTSLAALIAGGAILLHVGLSRAESASLQDAAIDTAIIQLTSDFAAHKARFKPADVESLGTAALSHYGDQRFFGLWRVLDYYMENQDQADFDRWIGKTRAAALQLGDPELARLADIMVFSQQNRARGDNALETWLASRDGLRASRNIRRIALLGELRSDVTAQHWAQASRVGASLIEDLDSVGPAALPIESAVHNSLANALTDLGDYVGALDHMYQCLKLDRRIGSLTQDSEKVYDLSYTALIAGRLDLAERLAHLHTRLIQTSGGPNAKFFNRFLRASIDLERQDFRRTLADLSNIAPALDAPQTRWAVSALKLRLSARAQLGDRAGAEADFRRLETVPPSLRAAAQTDSLYYRALVEHVRGQGALAFDDLARFQRQQARQQETSYIRRLNDMTAALRIELQAAENRSAQLTRAVELGKWLARAAWVIAALMAVIIVGGGVWAHHLRLMSYRLKRARNEAEAANAAKSAFLAMVSHELRTPLNGMLGMAHTLDAEPLSSAQASKVKTLIESGAILLSLLNDILDLAKVEAGKLDIAPAVGDLAAECAAVVRLYEPVASEKALSLVFSSASHVPARLMFDPLRIRQCLANLISNALKFTKTGGVRVELSCPALEADGKVRVEIKVIDTGMGMSEEVLGRLFDAYAQAEAATSQKFGGTGLGLNITRRLARLMQGDVTATSRVGEGSTFTLTLLAAPADEAASDAAPTDPEAAGDVAATAVAAPDGAGLSGLSVLVVDDHPVNRMVIKMLLEPLDCLIKEAADGQAALAELSASPVDLVLMDVNMPVMDGLEATRRIRSDPRLCRLPVIGLTADVTDEQQAKCWAAGMSDVLEKPIVVQELIATLRAWSKPDLAVASKFETDTG